MKHRNYLETLIEVLNNCFNGKKSSKLSLKLKINYNQMSAILDYAIDKKLIVMTIEDKLKFYTITQKGRDFLSMLE